MDKTKKILNTSIAGLTALFLINIYAHFLPVGLAGLLFLLFLGINGRLWGEFLFKNFNNIPSSNDSFRVCQRSVSDSLRDAAFGSFTVLAFFSLSGAVIYYFYKLDNFIAALAVVICGIISLVLAQKLQPVESFSNIPFPILRTLGRIWLFMRSIFYSAYFILNALFYFIFAGLCFKILFNTRIHQAVNTPWVAIPQRFFIYYFLATLFLIIFFYKQKFKNTSTILLIIHSFLSVSVALLIYPLGYGFDSFIHQATEKLIALKGFVEPKTIYYLGQYSIVTIFHKATGIGIETIDKLLVPVLFSIFIPLSAFYAFFKGLKLELKTALLLSLFTLLLPFSGFIATTPQGLGNLFVLIIIFLGLIYQNNRQPYKIEYQPSVASQKKYASCLMLHDSYFMILLFLALAAFFIHPLAGIPAFIFVGLLVLNPNRLLYVICYMLPVSLAIPLIFLAASALSPTLALNLKTPQMNEVVSLFQNFWPQIPNGFNYIVDLAYLYIFNWQFIFIIFSLVTFCNYRKKENEIFTAHFLTFIILFINYFILKIFFSFGYLINYEQSAFSDRILEIAFYFLLPTALYGIYLLLDKAEKNSILFRNFLLILFAFWLSASFYGSYPRQDKNASSKGYNISLVDEKAVTYMESDTTAQNGGFIVLANQNISATALKKFGFTGENRPNQSLSYLQSTDSRYPGKYFYYPIPTSSPLYQYYLKMVYEYPSRQTINEAMDFLGVNLGYFAINDYWTNFSEIVEQAKQESDSWQAIDGGKIYVFKYYKK